MLNNTQVFSSWPQFEEDEIDAAVKVLKSGKVNYWTGGQCVQFEKEFAAFHHCDYGIACANGTLALELALKGINLLANSEVIVPARTFIATASAVVACQGIPVVADVDGNGNTGNISAKTIEPLITDKTRAIIVVHVAGLACDMDPIMKLAEQHNLMVIEDCAQAHGAKYKGRSVGSLGHVAAFSFCQDKIMTCGGEGGMLLTNDKAIWQRAWAYKDHGKNVEKIKQSNTSNGFRWLHDSFGSNFRMTEMQAAIGRVQLSKLPQWLTVRKFNAEFLYDNLKDVSGIYMHIGNQNFQHAFYKFYIYFDEQAINDGVNCQTIINKINDAGIPCFSGSCCEVYRELAFVDANLGPCAPLPVAQRLSQSSIMVQVDHTVTIEHLQRFVDEFKRAMAEMKRVKASA